MESLENGGGEPISQQPAPLAPASHPFRQIAENLIEYGTGVEQQLLMKSLEEALFCCIGFEAGVSSTHIETRLKRFLNRQSKVAFIQRFLSLYFFNCVWFQTGELFRKQALNSRAFEKDMKQVERICQRAVAAAYRQIDVLDERAAGELIRNIEQQLRGTVMLVRVACPD